MDAGWRDWQEMAALGLHLRVEEAKDVLAHLVRCGLSDKVAVQRGLQLYAKDFPSQLMQRKEEKEEFYKRIEQLEKRLEEQKRTPSRRW